MSTINKKRLGNIRRLYYKDGLSMQQIADHFSVSLKSVIYFMKKHDLTRRNFSEANKITFENKPLSFSIPKRLNKEQKDLKTMGVILYWSEGAKLGQTVDLANSDVDMIRLFLRFLRDVCRVDESKLRGYIYCHKDQNPDALIKFWNKVTRIPRSQFSKPYVRKDVDARRKHPKRMPHGLVHVRYSDLKLHRQILQWIDDTKHIWVGTQAVNEDGL